LMNVLGCSEPKLRFLHAVIPAGSTEQARVLTREIPDLSAAAIIETPDAAASAGIRKGSPGHLRVTSFNFNELQLEAEVPESGEGWLYYADAYHPGWHAEINRHPAPVLKANLGFKALRLSPGSQQVKMRFFDGSLSSACYLTALWGLGFAAWVLGMAVKLASGKGL